MKTKVHMVKKEGFSKPFRFKTFSVFHEGRSHNCRIRKAAPGDEKAIVNVFEKTYPNSQYPFKQFYDPNAIADWIKSKDTHMFVAELNNKVVGTATLIKHGSSGELGRLAVIPEYRGKCIATHLLKERIWYAFNVLDLHNVYSEGRAKIPQTLANLFKRRIVPYGLSPFKYIVANSKETVVYSSRHRKEFKEFSPFLIGRSKEFLDVFAIHKVAEADFSNTYHLNSYFVGNYLSKNYYSVIVEISTKDKQFLLKAITNAYEEINRLVLSDNEVTTLQIILKPATSKNKDLQLLLEDNGFIPTSIVPGELPGVSFVKLIDMKVPNSSIVFPENYPKEYIEAFNKIINAFNF